MSYIRVFICVIIAIFMSMVALFLNKISEIEKEEVRDGETPHDRKRDTENQNYQTHSHVHNHLCLFLEISTV